MQSEEVVSSDADSLAAEARQESAGLFIFARRINPLDRKPSWPEFVRDS